ncbi:MAG: SDR family oxidoreductase [Planctomycetota bacterium]|jgi:uncharacterized protein YbjT (DUF2867 family)
MICVTGAGGTVGSEVVRQLQAAGLPFRAAFFSEGKAEAARAVGIEAVVIDYLQSDTLERAFAGCERLFLLGPNTLDQTELELAAVAAAKVAGVRHVVKQSVLGAATGDYSLSQVHRPVEEALEASGMAWTFLRPNSFQQNVMTFMVGPIQAESAFFSATGEAKVSHVDVRDIAAVAVKALSSDEHVGKAYDLTGPEALSYDELAGMLSAAVGRPIGHVSLPPADLEQAMLASGMPGPLAARMLDLDRYMGEGHAAAVSGDVETVTGQPPRSFAAYVDDIAGELAGLVAG